MSVDVVARGLAIGTRGAGQAAAAAAQTYAALAAAATGIPNTYATYSAANAALGSIAANAFAQVLVDETRSGDTTIYQKVGGVLVYVMTANPGVDLGNRPDPTKGAAFVGYRYGTVTGQFDILQRRPKNLHARIAAAIGGTATAAKIVSAGDSLATLTTQHLLPPLDRKMGGVNSAGLNTTGLASGMGIHTAGNDLQAGVTTGSVVDETLAYQYAPTGNVFRMDAGSTRTFVLTGSAPRFTRIRAYYIKEPGAGFINWTIAGAAQSAVDASLAGGATPTLGVLEFTQAYGQATAQLVVAGGAVRILFVHAENQSASGVDHYGTLARGGLLLADAVSSAQGVAIWQATIAAIAPNVVTFQMNDDFAFNGDGASSAAFQTFTTMLDAACPTADKIIIGSTPRLTGGDTVKEAARSWLRNQCQIRNSGYIFWDAYAPMGSYPEMSAAFPGDDGEHPTAPAEIFLGAQLWEFLGLSSGALGYSPQPVRANGQPSLLAAGTTWGSDTQTAGSVTLNTDSFRYDWWFTPNQSGRGMGIGGTSAATCPLFVSGNTGISPNRLPNSWSFYGVGADIDRRKFSFATAGGKEVAKWENTTAATGYQTPVFEEVVLGKTSTALAPGVGFAKLAFVAGTIAGTAKLVAYAGTSNTPVTIMDNIGTGF